MKRKSFITMGLALVMSACMAVPAFAAENVQINDGLKAKAYVVENVESKSTLMTGSEGLAADNFWLPADFKMEVLTVKPGVKIDLQGCYYAGIAAVSVKDGKVYMDTATTEKLSDAEIIWTLIPNKTELDESDNYAYKEGTNLQIMREGYYAFAAGPMSPKDESETVCRILHVTSGSSNTADNNTAVKPAQKVNAAPTASKVLVNGAEVAFDAYNINNNNYFKLRDVAKAISGSEKQFAVTYDHAKKAVNMISGQAYESVGGELAKGDGIVQQAVVSNSVIYKDGVVANLAAYNIKGNNYFKLRDLGETFNFNVSWDKAANAVVINTAESYTEN